MCGAIRPQCFHCYDIYTQVDLNGDGKPEFVAVTPGGQVILAAPRKPGDGFAPAFILAQKSVSSLIEHKDGDSEVPEVLALASGSLEKPLKDLVHRQRKQVIAAVCSDGSVALIDSNLRLKWKSSIPLISKGTELKDVSVVVTPHAGNTDVGGMVVVSVREHAELHDADYEDDDDDDEATDERDEIKHERGRDQDESLEELDSDPRTKARHVSYFAFAGGSGNLLWKHSQEDFHKDPMSLTESGIKTLYSDRVTVELQDGIHYGERSCREYRESVLASLPHVWFDDEDSFIQVAHFHKHRKHHGAQRHKLGAHSIQKDDTTNTPPATHYQWKKKDVPLKQQTQPPNVIVSHVEDGMEVIHLFSGRPVCRLRLDKKVLHIDVNGDGVPDHVHVSGGIPRPERIEMDIARHQVGHERIGPCMTRVTSGIPPSISLFNGTICSATVRNRPGSLLDIAPPVALQVPNKNGHYSKMSLHQKMNLFYFNSRGEVTSYDHTGEKLFTIQTGIEWKQRYPNFDSESWGGDEETAEEDEDDYSEDGTSVPTFRPFSFHKHGIPSGIVASGAHLATVLSEQGNEIWTGYLPHPPTQQLVQMDFNMDGYMDIVLVSRQGLYGWTQVRSPGGVSVSALVGGLIVVLVVVLISQNQFEVDGTRRKGRSTDRVD